MMVVVDCVSSVLIQNNSDELDSIQIWIITVLPPKEDLDHHRSNE
jgi:hypothetical protein